jgi:hypothetical protein
VTQDYKKKIYYGTNHNGPLRLVEKYTVLTGDDLVILKVQRHKIIRKNIFGTDDKGPLKLVEKYNILTSENLVILKVQWHKIIRKNVLWKVY